MAYKVFTNGSPLPASDLNTYLMNQSVMVFANSTARSAALTAPTEGMVTYLEDTGLVYVYNGSSWVDINDNSGAIPKSTVTTAGDLIVADGSASVTRLGIGSNGQVLSSNGTTATWTTPAGGGDKVYTSLLDTTITTGSTTYSVTGLSSYDTYVVYLQDVSCTGTNGAVYLKADTDATPRSFVVNTGWVTSSVFNPSVDVYSASDSIWIGQYGGGATRRVHGLATFNGCKGTSPGYATWLGGTQTFATGAYQNFGSGLFGKSGSVTGFTVTTDSNIDAGSIKIWGA